MTTSPAELVSDLTDSGLQLNIDLAAQINEMVSGAHASSECWQSGRLMLLEGAIWSAFGAALWVATLYLFS